MAGGYDDLFRAWGAEDSDFYSRLRHCGIRPGWFSNQAIASIDHEDGDRTKFYEVKQIKTSQAFYDVYCQLKLDYTMATGKLTTREERLRLLNEAAVGVDPDLTSKLLPDLSAPVPSVTVFEPQPVPVPEPTPEDKPCRHDCARTKHGYLHAWAASSSKVTVFVMCILAAAPRSLFSVIAAVCITVASLLVHTRVLHIAKGCDEGNCQCCSCGLQCRLKPAS
jgi:hypothetical protein